ncbi:uncharacterized protein [Typha latifolia]|uniref:uncharacterized protein n=1 Tax=Typha latifolia TaxID=4733 RepID=UPI003C2D5369
MAGIYIPRDEIRVDPLLISFRQEQEEKEISTASFCENPPQDLLGFDPVSSSSPQSSNSDHSDIGDRRCFSQEDDALLEAVLDELFGERDGGPEKKRKRDVEEMVRWVRDLAAGPVEEKEDGEEWEQQILRCRQALLVKMEGVADMEGFPSLCRLKKQKTRSWSLESRCKNLTEALPTRRSERLSRITRLTSAHLIMLRKRIGRGDSFQADIPEWTGPPSEKDISDYKEDKNISRMLGTRVWPVERYILDTYEAKVGKGRSDLCQCSSPGSMACIRSHTSMARNQLKYELGETFSSWGFDRIGEGVSGLLTYEGQMRFSALERINPIKEHGTFGPAVSSILS